MRQSSGIVAESACDELKSEAMTQSDAIKRYDVVIVGGGIAGLTVAYRLRDRNILLLEKEDVCGGRTLSMDMGPFVFNQGAQMIPGANTNVARLADELEVKRVLIDKTKTCTHINGKLVAESSDLKYLLRLPIPLLEKFKLGRTVLRLRSKYSGIVDKPPDANDPLFRELSETSLVDLLKIKHPDVKALWDSFSMAASTLASDEVAAFQPINTFLHHAADEYYVEGGTGQLTQALANRIGDRAVTNATVTDVVPDGDGVAVQYEQDGISHTVEADRCVMAVPAPLALRVLRDLPEAKRAALAQCEYGAMTSAAFLLDKPSESFLGEGVWRIPVAGKVTCGISDPTYTFPVSLKREDGRGLIRLYTGDKASKELQKLPDDEALDILERDLVDIFPLTQGRTLERSIKHWPHAICPWRVGRLSLIDDIRATHDNIHYCGDYTENSGLEPSVLSAQRVISEIAD